MEYNNTEIIEILTNLGFKHSHVDNLDAFLLDKLLKDWFPDNKLVEHFSDFVDYYCNLQILFGGDSGFMLNYTCNFNYSGQNVERLHELVLNENFGLRGMRIYLAEDVDNAHLEAVRVLSKSELFQLIEINALEQFLRDFAFRGFYKLMLLTHEALHPGSLKNIMKDENNEFVPVFESKLPVSYFIEIIKNHLIEKNIEITSIDDLTIGFKTSFREDIYFQTICKFFPSFGITSLFIILDNDLGLGATEIGKFNTSKLYSSAKLEATSVKPKSIGIQTDFIISEEPEVLIQRFDFEHKTIESSTLKYFAYFYIPK